MSHPAPDLILASLLEGNRRFREGRPEHPQQDPSHRADLVGGQNPKAAILSCADSRVPSELIFDQGLGDLFVVRGAGQIADETNLASLEYAVAALGVRLILVMGHESCGAVQAAIEAEASGAKLRGHLPHLVDAIRPAIAAGSGIDQLRETTVRHVLATCALIREAEPILSENIRSGDLLVIPAFYSLADGHLELLH